VLNVLRSRLWQRPNSQGRLPRLLTSFFFAVRKKADRIIKTTPKANEKNPKWDEELKVAVEVCRLPLLWALYDFHLYDTLFPGGFAHPSLWSSGVTHEQTRRSLVSSCFHLRVLPLCSFKFGFMRPNFLRSFRSSRVGASLALFMSADL
jgi:hypothetical protein